MLLANGLILDFLLSPTLLTREGHMVNMTTDVPTHDYEASSLPTIKLTYLPWVARFLF
jgi:hypothetical protein